MSNLIRRHLTTLLLRFVAFVMLKECRHYRRYDDGRQVEVGRTRLRDVINQRHQSKIFTVFSLRSYGPQLGSCFCL